MLHLPGKVRVAGAEGCMLQVITVTGVLVHTQRIINPDETIRLDHLPAGMYIFRVERNGKMKTVRAITELLTCPLKIRRFRRQ